MPNLDATFSILSYKFTTDVPVKNKARLFSCVCLSFENRYEKDAPTEFFAGQLTYEDMIMYLQLFKIATDTKDPIEAL
jgi:hypothetical protein